MNKKKRELIILITLLVFGFFSIAILFYTKKNTITKKEIEIFEIVAQPDMIYQGTVASSQQDEYLLDASLGSLESINVENGQEVKVGDILLTYKSNNTDMVSLEYAIKTAQLSLSNSLQTLSSSQERGNQLQNRYNQAISNKKIEQVNPTDMDNLSAITPESIQVQIDSNNQLIQQNKQTVAINQLALEQAQANLIHTQNSKTVTILAKQDGLAIVGNVNDLSRPLVQILNKNTIINGQISEFDYPKIRVGEKVIIRPINLDEEVTGTIISIGQVPNISSTTAGGNNSTSISYYSFVVRPDKDLQFGYGVQIHVIDTSVFIPKSALKDGYVEKKNTDGTFTKVDVEIQERNGELEVVSGLSIGDFISKNGDVE